MSFTLQLHNNTSYDRYPDVFTEASQYLREPGLNILSFGCSTGDEVFTLADKYLKQAKLIGLDVNQEVLSAAKSKQGDKYKNVTFDVSSPENLIKYGPYDAIFALSVLCAWPESKTVRDINGLFSFQRFEEFLQALDANLKPGGLLVVYNSNFRFCDSALASKYCHVPTPGIKSSGFVTKFDKSGLLLDDPLAYDKVIFRKK